MELLANVLYTCSLTLWLQVDLHVMYEQGSSYEAYRDTLLTLGATPSCA